MEETLKVLSFLEKGKPNSHHDWKHRFKENSERHANRRSDRSGGGTEKPSFVEPYQATFFPRKENAGTGQIPPRSELATARNTSTETMEDALIRSLAKARLQMPSPLEKSEAAEILAASFGFDSPKASRLGAFLFPPPLLSLPLCSAPSAASGVSIRITGTGRRIKRAFRRQRPGAAVDDDFIFPRMARNASGQAIRLQFSPVRQNSHLHICKHFDFADNPVAAAEFSVAT